MLPSLISANEKCKNTATVNTTQEYPLYKRIFIVFGERGIKDTFTTPPDCKKLGVRAIFYRRCHYLYKKRRIPGC